MSLPLRSAAPVRAALAALLVLLLTPAARAGTITLELSGRELTGARTFRSTITVIQRGGLVIRREQGKVSIVQEPEWLEVRRSARFADGTTLELSGRGAWRGDTLEASFEAPRGASGALRGQAGQELGLVLEVQGESLTARLLAGNTVIALAEGTRPGGASPPAAPGSVSPAAVSPAAVSPAAVSPAAEAEDEGLPLPSLEGTKAERTARFPGLPFVLGAGDRRAVAEDDVQQGELGNCYLLATLAAVARTQPRELERRLRDLGGGQYEVRFGPTDSPMLVNDRFPAERVGGRLQPVFARFGDRDDAGRPELWPMLFEKAWAQRSGGYGPTDGGHPAVVLARLTGGELRSPSDEALRRFLLGAEDMPSPSVWSLSLRRVEARTALRIAERVMAQERPAVVSTRAVWEEGAERSARELGLLPAHAYTLLGARDGGIYLRNPWGHDHPARPLTPAELLATCEDVTFARF
ncbi:MAG: C2 family cysteine protease [Planctomycetota bacterium]